jgi:hypothetical protein
MREAGNTDSGWVRREEDEGKSSRTPDVPCHQRKRRASWQQLEGNGEEGVGDEKRRADEAGVPQR